MDLGLAGQRVVSTEFGYTATIVFSGGFEIRVESAFTLRAEDGDRRLTPGADIEQGAARLGTVVGHVVVVAAADDGGELRVDLDGGMRLLVGPDPDYEAWTFAGADGTKVVCRPGGGLAVWSPHS
jgi:Family of unknown function (DUF6188)